MLAWYSFDTDEQQLLPSDRVATTLARLAARCPATLDDVRTRLVLKTAAAAVPDGVDAPTLAGFDRVAAHADVERVLASPAASRENVDLLTNAMTAIVKATTDRGTPARATLVADADRALARLAADATLSNTDRLGALEARVELAGLGTKSASPTLSDAMRRTIVDEVARVDRESTSAYERQTAINAAASLLSSAGLLDESDALLRAELAKSHAPYYFMLDLAANARKRGDRQAALDWYAKAYDAAVGPATRLQWGTIYVGALVDLAPDDATRIADAATRVIGEIDARRRELRRSQPAAARRHDGEARRVGGARRACGRGGAHRRRVARAVRPRVRRAGPLRPGARAARTRRVGPDGRRAAGPAHRERDARRQPDDFGSLNRSLNACSTSSSPRLRLLLCVPSSTTIRRFGCGAASYSLRPSASGT